MTEPLLDLRASSRAALRSTLYNIPTENDAL
jgi:hypothetical protein